MGTPSMCVHSRPVPKTRPRGRSRPLEEARPRFRQPHLVTIEPASCDRSVTKQTASQSAARSIVVDADSASAGPHRAREDTSVWARAAPPRRPAARLASFGQTGLRTILGWGLSWPAIGAIKHRYATYRRDSLVLGMQGQLDQPLHHRRACLASEMARLLVKSEPGRIARPAPRPSPRIKSFRAPLGQSFKLTRGIYLSSPSRHAPHIASLARA